MSSNTSTLAELSSSAYHNSGFCWRVVEAQNHVSTFKLTDNKSEQTLLEQIIENSKPMVPPECRHLNFLLYTPFRYGTYKSGSRFRRAGMTLGVFYAAESVETAIAESAFWRLIFYSESPDTPWPTNPGQYTAFSCEYATDRAVDLARPPLDARRENWMHPTNYDQCQALADVAREGQIDIIRYSSVRDPKHRANIAILTCRAFSRANEAARQTWHIYLSGNGARTRCEMPPQTLDFNRQDFAIDPRISKMKWDR